MKNVLVIGGGASGMMAAVIASRNHCKVTLLEKNEKLGKKLFITGKGRCNLTNACDSEQFFRNVIRNPRFLYSAYSRFPANECMRFFEELGLPLKVERGNRVFPVSDHSSDVIRVLEAELRRCNVTICLRTKVMEIMRNDQEQLFVKTDTGATLPTDAVIIATGGLSYASTGSTGDGYHFARSLGHTIRELSPSLTSIVVKQDDIRQLEGLSLKNVSLCVKVDDIKKEKIVRKVLYEELGEMVFTRNGISGPLILSASAFLAEKPYSGIELSIDLKPGLSKEALDQRILRDFETMINKQFRNSLGMLLPGKMQTYIVNRSGIDPFLQVNQISAVQRSKLGTLMKNITFDFASLGSYSEAVVTRGGIAVNEVNPATMESKLAAAVYFTGEILDLDAMTGGFNLQIAWSTGYAAGLHVSGYCDGRA